MYIYTLLGLLSQGSLLTVQNKPSCVEGVVSCEDSIVLDDITKRFLLCCMQAAFG